MHNRRLFQVTGILSIAAMATTGAGNAANDNSPGDGGSTADPIAVTSYAEDYQVSASDAERILAEQGEFSEFYTGLREEHGQDQLDAYVLTSPAGENDFHVRSDVPAILSAAQAFEERVGVEVSAEESMAFQSVTANELAGNAPQLSTLAATEDVYGFYVDPASGELRIDAGVASQGVQQREAPSTVEIDGQDLDVTVTRHGGEVGDTNTIRGGAAMSTCTSAFTATSTQFGNGVYTAGHCSGAQTLYAGVSTASTVVGATTVRHTNYGANSDIAFRSAPASASMTSTFWGSSTSSTQTQVTGINMANGSYACTRGMTTGYRCGTVSLNYAPTWDGACPGGSCNANFARVDGAGTDGGDSGGPWWSGSSSGAISGIHKGGGASFSVYSLIEYAPSGTAFSTP